jgi:hypothetical protein
MPLPWSGLLNGKIINLKMTSFDEFVTATKALAPIYLGFAGVILFLLLVLHLLGASPSAKAKRKAV